MQMESRVVSTLHSQTRPTTIVRLNSETESSAASAGSAASAEHSTSYQQRHDTLAAAVVIGLTAQFVAILFGLVTDLIPGLLLNILLGSFIGTAAGLISYQLMK